MGVAWGRWADTGAQKGAYLSWSSRAERVATPPEPEGLGGPRRHGGLCWAWGGQQGARRGTDDGEQALTHLGCLGFPLCWLGRHRASEKLNWLVSTDIWVAPTSLCASYCSLTQDSGDCRNMPCPTGAARILSSRVSLSPQQCGTILASE